ncbi:MAG TPA: DUF4435 domain-containing protein [Terriglobales bacterium]
MSGPPSDLPARSQSGMAALDIFYSEFNEVNFYVEDEEQENLYFEIFRKLFKRIRIARIFPLGGKSAVFQHATSEANQGIRGFKVYIVDRDFDHLLGKRFEHPNVFYLDRFCIENHLLEPAAIVELVIENHPKRRRTDVETELSLNAQILSLYNSLRSLFMLFFCAQFLNLGVRNCSSPPESFCEPKRLWELKGSAIISYRGKLKVVAGANGLVHDLFDSQCDLAFSRARTASDNELVSGKFVAAMLFHYVKSKYSLGSMTFESFVYRLAKNCTLRSMRGFAVRVRAGVRSHRAAP